ncbi:TRAP transporter large permease [uncultured Paracoccus sp.]|jgi:C4-dicarboxylate transporter DctM subunit|uniref:TRAP transporter large permease n=1 Tax=Paracoccus sp. TaxID=267 RepID=UPI0026335F76|nr:TRAP transporter large permease [uncultured Paracoccus sp.]|tara:strand:- start:3331 stop:4611 length:1281 start_codon:yes stop_codon:yes gene_type:complete
MTLIAVLVFFALALLGTPLAFALGLGSVAGLMAGDIPMTVLPQRMMHAVNSFPLMAIPLFMLAGELMVKAGIMQRLVEFSNAIVGRLHGGVAHMGIVAGMMLAAVSGAAVASASALGSALVPAMRRNYDDGFSSAVIASAANLGAIIPPSNAMIVYALMAGSTVSVGGLFMAGVVPGLLLTFGFIALASFISWRRGYPLTGQPFSVSHLMRETWRALPVLMMPVVVIGGIVGGVFTPTEGAAIAVVYAMLVGFFLTGKLRLSDLPSSLFRAAVGSAMVAALIAFAAGLTFLMTVDMVPSAAADFLQGLTANPMMFLILVMILLIIVGMFIESNAAYIMLVPILAPIAVAYGIDPLLFGLLFVLNLVAGMMTPPVGVVLFVMCGITKVSMASMIRNVWPFVAVQYLVLLLCLFVPGLVTWLPRILGY